MNSWRERYCSSLHSHVLIHRNPIVPGDFFKLNLTSLSADLISLMVISHILQRCLLCALIRIHIAIIVQINRPCLCRSKVIFNIIIVFCNFRIAGLFRENIIYI